MSGGLDSSLAAAVVQAQGIEVIGLHLSSPFGCRDDVAAMARQLGIRLLTREKGDSYLDLVKKPRFGYGRNFNPCIDCRIFMFQIAEEVRASEGADFIITGEVSGQRPKSQIKSAMRTIDAESEIGDRILRPLSVQSFDLSYPEKMGWIDRRRLHRITGRGRTQQLALAKQYGIESYSSPAGGCLLTEASFASRLRDFFGHDETLPPAQRMAQAQLLRVGRHFRFSDTVKAIVGRNQAENGVLAQLWQTAGAGWEGGPLRRRLPSLGSYSLFVPDRTRTL